MAKVVGRLDRTGGNHRRQRYLPHGTGELSPSFYHGRLQRDRYADRDRKFVVCRDVDTATMAQIVDVTGTPEKVTLTGFLMQSCSGHRWCAVGY